MDIQTPFYTDKKFRDPQNFPYGFARSGEFTIAQARLIETFGHAYAQLASGTRQPNCEEETAFVACCHGAKDAETVHERAWQRYQNKANSPRATYTLARGSIADSLAHETQVYTG